MALHTAFSFFQGASGGVSGAFSAAAPRPQSARRVARYGHSYKKGSHPLNSANFNDTVRGVQGVGPLAAAGEGFGRRLARRF